MPPRPTMTESTKRAALIRAAKGAIKCAETGRVLTIDDALKRRVHLDHRPPLALRDYDELTRKYRPDANDPYFIDVVSAEGHSVRTHKKSGLSRGDLTEMAHGRRLREGNALYQARMAAKAEGRPKPERKCQKIKSRGFDKTLKKPMRGPTVRRHT